MWGVRRWSFLDCCKAMWLWTKVKMCSKSFQMLDIAINVNVLHTVSTMLLVVYSSCGVRVCFVPWCNFPPASVRGTIIKSLSFMWDNGREINELNTCTGELSVFVCMWSGSRSVSTASLWCACLSAEATAPGKWSHWARYHLPLPI